MWQYNELDLMTKAWTIEQIDGLGIPGLRGSNVELPATDGERWVRKHFEARRMPFKGAVFGRDPDTGQVLTTEKQHLEDNINLLSQMFASRRLRPLTREMADGTTISALAEVAGSVEFTGNGQNFARFVVEFNLPDPLFYADTKTTHTLPSETNKVYNPGTADGDRLTITLNGPLESPKITNSTTGAWLQLAGSIPTGQTATVNTVDYTAAINGLNAISAVRHGNDFRWLALEPGENILTLEGGAGSALIEYYPAYF